MKSKTIIVIVSLAACFVMTMSALISYAAVQQMLRQSANWPQAQMAWDGAAAIASGEDPGALTTGRKVDIANSLSPFLIVYDSSGAVVSSSGELNGAVPAMPSGVLDYARKNGEDRVTWTPEKGVRIAAIAVSVNGGPGGTVVAGRSLKESENTTGRIGKLILAAWAGSILCLLAASLITLVVSGRKAGIR